ncbi:MAG: HEAT repeat domain-containing protein [Polyangiaceae bacterium]|nr:HEAT repeat domain-containing protein [Polyangiaceae bacterium]
MHRLGLDRIRRALVLLGVLLLLADSSPADAQSSVVSRLIDRLEQGEDFRVRVQAALELGKSKDDAARLPLERALADGNAAVRAACAAALKVLGDKRSIAALQKREKDPSAAVRAQVKASIEALRAAGESEDKPRVLLRIGKMKDAKGVRSGDLLEEVEQTARKRFQQIPGVRVLDGNTTDSTARLPLVMVTGQVRRLLQAEEGSSVTFSASVEYLVQRMPDQAIAGTVSGSASTTATKDEAKDRRRNAELRRAVLSAAVESAVRRSPDALFAAAK